MTQYDGTFCMETNGVTVMIAMHGGAFVSNRYAEDLIPRKC